MKLFSKCLLFALAAGCMLGLLTGCSGAMTPVPSKVDVSGMPPAQQIMELAATGDTKGLKALIDSDASLVNQKGDRGRTPLHFAAGNDQASAVKLLLDLGANPGAQDDDGETPADAALKAADVNLSKLLREAASKGTPKAN